MCQIGSSPCASSNQLDVVAWSVVLNIMRPHVARRRARVN